MKMLNVDTPITSIDGTPLKETEIIQRDDGSSVSRRTEKPLTLKTVVVNALLHAANDNDKTTGEAKIQRFLLAETIYKATGKIEIGNDDAAIIMKLVSAVSPVLVVGQVHRAITGGGA